VLELGAGDGFQGSLLSQLGCDVSSIDIDPRTNPSAEFHPVLAYDGRRIPFADDTFDAVFSSNVLEHLVDLPRVLGELRRVSRRDGLGVHLVPSAGWRFWTMVTHYPWLVQRLLRPTVALSAQEPTLSGSMRRNTPAQLVSKILGLAPHGEHISALTELYHFRRARWLAVLAKNGFDAIYVGDNSLFYTGHMLASGLSMTTRRRLANVLGAACHVFVVKTRDSL
jgi:SAM-dependent methyltransferase